MNGIGHKNLVSIILQFQSPSVDCNMSAAVNHSADIVHQCYTQGCSGVTTHAFLKMPLHSPVLTLCTPFETRVKDMTKQLERTSVIDEVIIEKLFF